jgi:tetratricopeptide (TPR) repeat protein
LLREALSIEVRPFHFWNLSRFVAEVRNNPIEAEHLLREAVALEPQKYSQPLARTLEGMERYDEAEVLYRRAVDLTPDDVYVVTALARFLANIREQHNEAIVIYRRAIQLDPSNENIKEELGELLEKIGID